MRLDKLLTHEARTRAAFEASQLMLRDELLESNRQNGVDNTPTGEMTSFATLWNGRLGVAAFKNEEGYRVVHSADFTDALGRQFETLQAAEDAAFAELMAQSRFVIALRDITL